MDDKLRREQATEIFRQLGGQKRLAALVGATNFTFGKTQDGDTVVSFKIKASREVNMILISLTPADTYTVKLANLTGINFRIVKEYKGVQNDNLLSVLEEGCACYFSLTSV